MFNIILCVLIEIIAQCAAKLLKYCICTLYVIYSTRFFASNIQDTPLLFQTMLWAVSPPLSITLVIFCPICCLYLLLSVTAKFHRSYNSLYFLFNLQTALAKKTKNRLD